MAIGMAGSVAIAGFRAAGGTESGMRVRQVRYSAGRARCGGSPAPAQDASQMEGSSRRGPASADIQVAASLLLGSNAEVLAFGNLAGNGHVQALVVNRAVTSQSSAGEAAPAGTQVVPFTRAAVIERNGTRWIEVLRCDEHLTNSKGFLAGAPLSPVTGWLVRWSQQEDGVVQAMYFTPGRPQGEVLPEPVAVRWNPKVNRYQSIDRTTNQFLNELALLETPTSTLK